MTTLTRYDIGFGALKGPEYNVGESSQFQGGTESATQVPPDSGAQPKPVSHIDVVFNYDFAREGIATVSAKLIWPAVTLCIDNSEFTRLSHFDVSYKIDGTGTDWVDATTAGLGYDFFGFTPGAILSFRVRVVSTDGQFSTYTFNNANQTPSDDGPPPQPSQPAVEAKLGILTAIFDGKSTSTGTPTTPVGGWPPDLAYIEVHASTVNDFVPDASTLRDSLPPIPQRAPLTGFAYGTPVYVKLVAVDLIGLKSAPSAQGTGTPAPLVAEDITIPDITFDFLHPDLQSRLDVDRQLAIDAGADADAAQQASQVALTSANSKSRNYYSASPPSPPAGQTHRVDDLWFETDNGFKPYRWNGSNWIETPFGDSAIATIDAGKITTGQLDAARINAKSIGVEKLVVGGFTESEVPNGGFEELGSNNLPLLWNRTHGSWATDGSTVRSGSRSVVMTADGSGLARIVSEDAIPVAEGAWVYSTGWYQGAGQGLHQIFWYGSNGAYISASNSPHPPLSSVWQQISVTAQAPLNARFYRIAMRITGASGTVGRVDDGEARRAIGGAQILNASINTAHIGTLTVNSAQISTVSAGAIQSGTVSADLVVGQRFRTSSVTARVEMNGSGLFAVNSSGTTTFALNANGGSGVFSGNVTAQSGSHYVQLYPNSSAAQIDFKIANVANVGWLRMLTFSGSTSAYAGGTAYARPGLELRSPSKSGRVANIILGAPNESSGSAENHTTFFANADRMIFTTTEGLEFRNPAASASPGNALLAGPRIVRSHDIEPFSNSTLHYPVVYFVGQPLLHYFSGLIFARGQMIWSGNRGSGEEIQARPYGGNNAFSTTVYSAYAAAAFRNTSDERTKRGIRTHGVHSALADIDAYSPAEYWLADQDPEVDPPTLGFITQQLPDHLRDRTDPGEAESYTISAMLAHLWISLQEVNVALADANTRLAALEQAAA